MQGGNSSAPFTIHPAWGPLSPLPLGHITPLEIGLGMTIENPKEVQEGLGSGEIVMVMRKRLGVIRLISGRATAFRLGLGFFAPLLFASGGLAVALATGHWANVLALPLACWIVFLPSGLSLVFFHVLPFLALSCLGLIVAPFFPRIGPELFVIPYLGMFGMLIHKEAL